MSSFPDATFHSVVTQSCWLIHFYTEIDTLFRKGMKSSTVLLKQPQVVLLNLTNDNPANIPEVYWRRQYLMVMSSQKSPKNTCTSQKRKQDFLLLLNSREWIEACLSHSSVRAVCLDTRLDIKVIELWANASAKAGKQIYLQLPSTFNLPQSRAPIAWRLKQMIDWNLAIFIFLIMSPILIGAILTSYIKYPNIMFVREWRVGRKGKLFQSFALVAQQDQQLLPVICKLAATLMQLPNIVLGNMSFVGPHPLSIEELVKSDRIPRPRLKAVPGLTGWLSNIWAKSTQDFKSDSKPFEADIHYLEQWSLLSDVSVLCKCVWSAIIRRNCLSSKT